MNEGPNGMKLYCSHASPAQSTEGSYGTFRTSKSGQIPPSAIETTASTLDITSSTLSAYMQYNGVMYLVWTW